MNNLQLLPFKNKHIILNIVFIFFIVPSLFAQETRLFFRNLSVEEGLSDNKVNCIMQDSKGFMWFGTENGLNRYDGYEFKILYSNEDNYRKNKIFCIMEDPDKLGSLWLGTNDGVKIYDNFSDTLLTVRIPDYNIKIARSIVRDHFGDYWIAADTVLLCYNPEMKRTQIYTHQAGIPNGLPSKVVLKIFEDAHFNLWIGTSEGICRYDRTNDKFIHYPNLGELKSKNNSISVMKEDADGNLIIFSLSTGIMVYNPEDDIFRHLEIELDMKGSSREILKDKNNILWIASSGSGLIKFDEEKGFVENYKHDPSVPNSISDDFLSCLYQDRGGSIWIGTKHSGVDRFIANSTSFFNYQHYENKKNSLTPGRVFAMYQDSAHTFWAATKGCLNEVDLRNRKIKNHYLFTKGKSNRPIRITFITEISPKQFLLGTMDAGMILFDPRTNKYESVLPALAGQKKLIVFVGLKDKSGTIWLALNNNSIIRYWPHNKSYKFYNIIFQKNQKTVLKIYEKKNGEVLASVLGGKLFKYNPETDDFKLIYQFNPQNKVQIWDMTEDEAGNLWLATNRSIFMLSSNNDSLNHFGREHGIYISDAYCLFMDNFNTLWLSHRNGLTRFKLDTYTAYNYDYRNGLTNISFRINSSYKSSDGRLFFGHLNGFTMLDKIENLETRSAQVGFTGFDLIAEGNVRNMLEQGSVSGEPIELPYNNYQFIVKFALFDFENPSRNTFQYMIEGMEDIWIDLGTRNLLDIVNLPPGSYNFRLKAKNAHGIESKNELSVKFKILAPFWQTWWFRTWAAILMILFIVLVYRMRVYSIRRRNLALERINKKLNEQINVRRQVEKMLTDSEIKYRTLVEGIEDGIFTINAEGVFHFMNNIAAARFGGKPADLSGRSIYEFIPDNAAKQIMADTKRVFRDGKSRDTRIELNENGDTIYYNFSIHPLKNEQGETTLTLNIAVDTSDKIALENQLRQSQKMEAVGNLAGGIAHDFNNLLSIIRGYSFLLLAEEKPGDPTYESIREIDSAGERAQTLTRQLLAFSRKQMLEPRVINLNNKIREINKLLDRLIRENIDLQLDLDSKLDHIFADPGQIEQVVMNLVVNARDAMPTGGKLIIRTQNTHTPEKLENIVSDFSEGSYISMSITDTGIGMKKELLHKIFDPFFTTKSTGKGTGLGLSTVFGIVKQSDGYIWVDSTPGEGSTFTVYFPAVNNKNIIADEEESIERKELRGSETILVVEDEKGVRSMIAKMLKLYGYSIMEAKSGQEGLSVYETEQQDIDLILTDVVMPDMSGVDMMMQVNQINPGQNAIYMSGYTDEEIVRHGILDRGIRFIQKPFTPDALMLMIRETLTVNSPSSK